MIVVALVKLAKLSAKLDRVLLVVGQVFTCRLELEKGS